MGYSRVKFKPFQRMKPQLKTDIAIERIKPSLDFSVVIHILAAVTEQELNQLICTPYRN